MTQIPTYEYAVGNILSMDVTFSGSSVPAYLDFEVLELLGSMCHAAILVVEAANDETDQALRHLETAGEDRTFVVKLFDRRLNMWHRAPSWHRDPRSRVWSQNREAIYQRHLRSGLIKQPDATRILRSYEEGYESEERFSLREDGATDLEEDSDEDEVERARRIDEHFKYKVESDMAVAKYEAYMTDWKETHRLEETHAYYLISQAEDQEVRDGAAHLLGTVDYPSPNGSVKGLLLEHLTPCISIVDYIRAAAPCGYMSEKVAKACDLILHSMMEVSGKVPMINTDIHTDNFFVVLEPGECTGA